jgi:hypothetical protein
MMSTPFSYSPRSDRPGTGGRLVLLLIILVIFTLHSRAQTFSKRLVQHRSNTAWVKLHLDKGGIIAKTFTHSG